MSFYDETELASLGLKKYGTDVLISRYARLYNPGNIVIGDHVRIDDFCLLSASNERPFILENYIHISAGVYIYGAAGLHIKSFSNLSAGVKVFTVSDTFDGSYLIGPTVPFASRKVIDRMLIIEKHTVIGASSTILPGFVMGEGVAIGANSLVNKHCDEWSVYLGSPIRKLKSRERTALEIERRVCDKHTTV